MGHNNIDQIIQSLEKRLDQRLEKLWKIFSWTNSILVALIAGLIILPRTQSLKLDTTDRVLISVVILIITLYAVIWINENLRIEGKIRDQLSNIFNKELKYSEFSNIRPDKTKFGYKMVLILLGITSLIAAWIDCF